MKKAGMLLFLLGATILFFNGCISTGSTKKTEWKPAKPASKPPYVHTVKYTGETLRIISKWYTGDVNNWESLADANPNIDYENMVKGSRVFIPQNLLRKTEPLTEKFIDSYNKKSKKKIKKEEKKKPVSKPKPAPRPKKDEDFDLIGPK